MFSMPLVACSKTVGVLSTDVDGGAGLGPEAQAEDGMGASDGEPGIDPETGLPYDPAAGGFVMGPNGELIAPATMADAGGSDSVPGGAGSGGTAGTGSPPRTDPWVPPFDEASLGEDGWKDSQGTLCTEGTTYVTSRDLWSDERGVYVLVGGFNDGDGAFMIDPSGATRCEGGGCSAHAVYFNDGSGWHQTFSEGGFIDFTESSIDGMPGGPLVLWSSFSAGPDPFGGAGSCALAHLDGSTKTCISGVDQMADFFGVSADRAYGIMDDKLIRWDGSYWGPEPTAVPYDISRLWADDTLVYGAGPRGTIVSYQGEWTVHDTRTLQSFTAIWGFAADDVWAGTDGGELLHYDGSSWERVSWPLQQDGCNNGIRGMWGAGGVLYLHTSTQLLRYSGGSFESLASWACGANGGSPAIQKIWGNAADELFLALEDPSFAGSACGSVFAVYFDGSKFHPF